MWGILATHHNYVVPNRIDGLETNSHISQDKQNGGRCKCENIAAWLLAMYICRVVNQRQVRMGSILISICYDAIVRQLHITCYVQLRIHNAFVWQRLCCALLRYALQMRTIEDAILRIYNFWPTSIQFA